MPKGKTGSKNLGALPVSGFINLYKPIGITSMEALRQVKRATGQRRKVGHAGTMDPLARGVLPVCFGQATRLMEYVVDGAKRYWMEMRLGATTRTYDSEGEATEIRDPGYVTPELVREALVPFIGEVEQKPPMFSAIKVDGQRLYSLARAGVEVERAARPVEIFDIQLLNIDLPNLTLKVECGRGVYMRSLAHDLGLALGCGAYVTDLERQYCAGFESVDGITPEELAVIVTESGDPEAWKTRLHPIDHVLRRYRAITVNESSAKSLRTGQDAYSAKAPLESGYLEQFRAYGIDGRFVALVRHDRQSNSWRPIKVFQTEEPSPHSMDAIGEI